MSSVKSRSLKLRDNLNEVLRGLNFRNSERDKLYLKTYPIFLEFFRQRIAITKSVESDLRVAVVLVYTWMKPAELKPEYLEPECFSKAKTSMLAIASQPPNEESINIIKSIVGNSLTAASKFLHFLSPDRYAIWDSKVAYAAYGLKYHSQYDKLELYLQYLREITDFRLENDNLERVRYTLKIKVSDLREKEFALFHLGISGLISAVPPARKVR